MRRHAFIAVLLCLAASASLLQAAAPDELISRQEGAIPIIVSAPHGGRKPIPEVPVRTGDGIEKFVAARDENTAELAEAFAGELEKAFAAKPWYVIAKFERKYADVNRPPSGAYESDKAKPVYDEYHKALANACKAVKEKYGRGLLLDVHGQGAMPDTIIRGTQNGKSVTLLRERFGKPAFLGKPSLLGRMEDAGYTVFPKSDSTEPEYPRLNGGYIVQTYGSHQGYAIDAIQLELGAKLRSKDVMKKTAKDLAVAVKGFHDEYIKAEKK